MIRFIAVLGCSLLLAACHDASPAPPEQHPENAAVATPPSVEETERIIRQSSAEWADVAVTGDPSPLARFIAEDYVGVSSWGEVRDKAKLLEPPAGRDYSASKLDYVNIRHFGDTAVAQGAETLTRRDGGPPLRLIWTDVWMFRKGRWQVVASQDSVRPPGS